MDASKKRDRKREKIRKRALEEDVRIITSKNRNRLAFGFAVLLLLMIALIFRMGYWQIYKSDELRVMAADMQKVDTEIDPARGSIYDSRMNTLAESVTEYELYAYTQFLYKDESISNDDKAKTILRLADITGKDAEEVQKGAKEFDKLQNSIDAAARRGYVDQIIKAEDTRKYVIGAFEMLYTKREDRPAKKHGTV